MWDDYNLLHAPSHSLHIAYEFIPLNCRITDFRVLLKRFSDTSSSNGETRGTSPVWHPVLTPYDIYPWVKNS